MIYTFLMDKYEEEFSKSVKEAAKKIVVDRYELAVLRFERLVSMMYILLVEKEEKFDLLVAGGNSGIFVMKVVELIYQSLELACPPRIVLPVVRPSNEEGIVCGEQYVESQLKLIDDIEIKKVLFVDDEIMRGQTAKVCFETVKKHLDKRGSKNFLSCTIVAENHFFVWTYELEGVSVRFLPFAMVLQGYNGNFGYLIDDGFLLKLETCLGNPIDRNKALALLGGGRIKTMKDKVSFFDSTVEEVAVQKVPDYLNKKDLFITKIKDLISSSIARYKKGEIKFRFTPQ